MAWTVAGGLSRCSRTGHTMRVARRDMACASLALRLPIRPTVDGEVEGSDEGNFEVVMAAVGSGAILLESSSPDQPTLSSVLTSEQLSQRRDHAAA